ncbi:heavy metal transporter [Roseivirga sp. 4D4]|uniref:mercuric transport protein MerTP n=1 Tax=Roseivirga sp. 4D4 TaxID=1889784 RepID=UPI000853C139|nr:mercuric transport protein MerTP [Roseivirga sp. 4D4]OEK03064.1 heavy metal transporter [Roseivirga sp. 4D4]
MKNKNSGNEVASAGVLTAVVSSLCCITPVFALISGTSGIAATFSWMEPYRPFLIGLTILVLAFAWYQKLKPHTAEEVACACDDDKPSFWQSRSFLSIVTVFAAVMLSFPSYAHVFYPENEAAVVLTPTSQVQTVSFQIEGMTCSGCEAHVKHAAGEVDGVIETMASYADGTAKVEFDASKTNKEDIIAAIKTTGYKVTPVEE